jgi:hypothetical protein
MRQRKSCGIGPAKELEDQMKKVAIGFVALGALLFAYTSTRSHSGSAKTSQGGSARSATASAPGHNDDSLPVRAEPPMRLDPREHIMAALSADPSPEEALEVYPRSVEETGVSHEDWTLNADPLFSNWLAMKPDLSSVHVSQAQCYVGGCWVKAHAPDAGALQDAMNDFVDSDPFRLWPGGKIVTPPTAEGDGVSNVIVLLRPEGL